MKSILVLFFFVLATTAILSQPVKPVYDLSVQSLTESWRADNASFGVNGMTWLNNFYHGKGSFVVSTPKGVFTWLIRFPWDTSNVFTWVAGNANIKCCDLNGDGIIDYIDELGNAYLGLQNGEPPTPNPIFIGRPDLVGDFNHDGKDDIWSFTSNSSIQSAIATVHFGNSDINSMLIATVPRSAPFDTSCVTTAAYITDQHAIRIISRVASFTSPFDGYNLYECKFDTLSRLTTMALDTYRVPISLGKPFATGIATVERIGDKFNFIAVETIDGAANRTNISVYDLSNSKVSKLYSNRLDGAGRVKVMRHCIENPPNPNVAILCSDNSTDATRVFMYDGDFSKGMNGLIKYESDAPTARMNFIESIYEPSKDSTPGIAVCNVSQLRFYNGIQRIVSVASDSEVVAKLPLIMMSPQPLQVGASIQFKYYANTFKMNRVSLLDYQGRELWYKTLLPSSLGWNDVVISHGEVALNSGTYYLRVQSDVLSGQFVVIIN